MTTSEIKKSLISDYYLTESQADKEVTRIILEMVNNGIVPIKSISENKEGKTIVRINI